MRWFRDAPLRIKLTLILLFVVTLALLASGITFLVNDVNMLKSSMVVQISSLSNVVGGQCAAALQFDVPSTAEDVLGSLSVEPMVVFACVYDAKGNVFATYMPPGSSHRAPPVAPDGHSFTPEGNLEVTHPILQGNRRIGTIYLRASMAQLGIQIQRQVIVMILVVVVALTASILVAAYLQRIISRPIRRLAETALAISTRGDYSLRVQKEGKDELGALYDGFNAMLTQIQKRDAELEQHRFSLEAKAADLQRANARLESEVAERKRAEERFRLAVEAAPSAMIMVDRDGTIVLVNTPAEQMFGYDRVELLGQCVDDLLPEPLRAAHPRHRADFLQDPHARGMGIGRDLRGRRKDGSEFPVEIGLNPIETEQGTLVLSAIIDITERKRAEEFLRKSHEELEQQVAARTRDLQAKSQELARSNTELEQFAYIASHDLQEPLRKVQAFGDLLAGRAGSALGEEERDYLKRMQAAAQRMQGLINDLLAFARVTSQAKPFVPVEMSRVAEEVLVDLEARLKTTGGRVEIGTLPTLDGDALQMRQLLQNLLGNALKFHRPDVPPVIHVEACVVPSGDSLPMEYSQSNQICEITVHDNGIGFEEKYLDRIFLPFQRLHGRGEYEGTGMGLAICRKIVERHGGTITARSTPGQGTIFIVRLPLRQPKGDEHHA